MSSDDRLTLPHLLDPISTVAAAMPGAALAGVMLVAAHLRGDKPLHPVGVVGDGALKVEPTAVSGVPVLDEAGSHPLLVRWSRAIGRASGASDVEGFALRLMDREPPADILFASTGSGMLTRYLLALRDDGEYATLTTLLPVMTDGGPLLLRLEPTAAPTSAGEPPAAYTLSWSRLAGAWHDTGSLEIAWRDEDAPVRFDPVANLLPGTRQFGAVAVLREPSYRAGRTVAPRAD